MAEERNVGEELKEWFATDPTSNPYKVDYSDNRFTDVEAAKKDAMGAVDETYGSMISESDKHFNTQIDAAKEWEQKQSQLQQEQSDFAIEQIEQQKEQAKKDYLKEQSGAYTDYKKQSNEFGAAAEQRAAQGMANTGFSESSQVSMYNTYQNRVAAARTSYSNAVMNYNNAIKDARLQNNSALAQIAYQSLQKQLELSLQGFQYKNTLVLDRANKKLEVENLYYNRYQDVLAQINEENALSEQIRQYNESMNLEKLQFLEGIREFNKNYKAQYGSKSGGTVVSGPGEPDDDPQVEKTDHYQDWEDPELQNHANAGVAIYEALKTTKPTGKKTTTVKKDKSGLR